MRDNHIPVEDRLRRRIANLRRKLPRMVPIGHGNPYYKCSCCERSGPELSYKGHYDFCVLPGIEKEINHYERLMRESEEKTFNRKST